MTPKFQHADLVDEPNGWTRRLRVVRDTLERPSGTAVVLLAVLTAVFAVMAGWIPSPLTTMARELTEHRMDMSTFTAALNRLAVATEKQTRILQYRECGDVRDPVLRAKCLE